MGQFSVLSKKNRRKREFSKQSCLQSWCYYKDLYGYKQGAVAPKRTRGPLIFISKLSSYNIKNQYAKFHKNLSAGSISVE